MVMAIMMITMMTTRIMMIILILPDSAIMDLNGSNGIRKRSEIIPDLESRTSRLSQ